MTASSLLEARQIGDGKAGKKRRHGKPKSRILPPRGAQLPRRGRAKLSRPPRLRGEARELQLNERREAPGTENNQWRRLL